MSPLQVGVEEGGDVVTVSLVGELDISTADPVERELVRVEEKAPRVIALDLRRLEFLDSTGLRLIIGADARAREAGRRLVIIPGPPAVQRVFRVTLLDRRLEFAEDPASIAAEHSADDSG